MIRNYFRSAFRNIKRHPFISFINIFGITVGLTCCLLILTYVINEKSYDRYNKNADDIYRVSRIFYSAPNVESLHLSSIAPAFGPGLKLAFSDMKEMTRTLPNGVTSFRYKEKLFNEQNTFFADENFFDFFTVPVLKGDRRKALTEWQMFAAADPKCQMVRTGHGANRPMRSLSMAYGGRGTSLPRTAGSWLAP